MNHFELFREPLRTFSALSRSRSRRGSWSSDVSLHASSLCEGRSSSMHGGYAAGDIR